MEKRLRIFTELKDSQIDAKNRIVISRDFRRQLGERETLFLLRRRLENYPLLVLKPAIKTNFAEMNEEERLREYLAVERAIDGQGRIEIPKNSLAYLADNRDLPKSIVQTGGGDRIFIWYPEDFKQWEKKYLELEAELY